MCLLPVANVNKKFCTGKKSKFLVVLQVMKQYKPEFFFSKNGLNTRDKLRTNFIKST